MYDYVKDTQFLKVLKLKGISIMQAVCHNLSKDYGIGSVSILIGSAKRNMITQNANKPIDLDYNLLLTKCEDMDGKELKQAVKESVDKALKSYGDIHCSDSTSVLTTDLMKIKEFKTQFRIDIAIVREDKNGYRERLIHEKTGNVSSDRWYWNKTRDFSKIREKEKYIHENNLNEKLREKYLVYKNQNLRNNDELHSFVCYERAVNDIANAYGYVQSSLTDNARAGLSYPKPMPAKGWKH